MDVTVAVIDETPGLATMASAPDIEVEVTVCVNVMTHGSVVGAPMCDSVCVYCAAVVP